jgi:hypothetical protein
LPSINVGPTRNRESYCQICMKECGPAAVVIRPSSPPIIAFTRFGCYLDTVPESIRIVRRYLPDYCGLLDDRTLYRQMGTVQLATGPIDKWCRSHVTSFVLINRRRLVGFFSNYPSCLSNLKRLVYSRKTRLRRPTTGKECYYSTYPIEKHIQTFMETECTKWTTAYQQSKMGQAVGLCFVDWYFSWS